MTAQILQLLCPTGDPVDCLPSANLKDDGENLIINAVGYMRHRQSFEDISKCKEITSRDTSLFE